MFEEADIPHSSVFQLSLVPGLWEIYVDGKNKDGVVIGTGEGTIQLKAGMVMNETIHVVPMEGRGFLSITISWPDSVLADPAVSGELTAVGSSAQSMAFTPDPDGLSATYQDSLGSGYYSITMQLADAGEPVWGTTEAGRVMSGYTSSRSYQLQEAVNRSGYGFEVIDDLQNSIDITLSGMIENLLPGEEMTVAANTSEPVDAYQWYLQGEPITDATTDSITLGSNLDAGVYWLDVLVQSGVVLSSERTIFRILQTEDDGTQIGPLVINEFMANPEQVSDSDGEWFEVVNIGSSAVDLETWVIRDEGSNSHTINQSLVIPPDEFLVFGNNAADSTNGGISVDYEYQGISLSNGNADAILLVRDDGTIIDAVRWKGASQLPVAEGASTAL
ncbi:MAG TPA: lamin tail domain-containing protein, partial [bacterium]|nr:lamin tail domain-containing protein [bacterium]